MTVPGTWWPVHKYWLNKGINVCQVLLVFYLQKWDWVLKVNQCMKKNMRLVSVVHRNGQVHWDGSVGCYGMMGQETDIYWAPAVGRVLSTHHHTKTLTANFEAGTIIPILQDTDAQWGEVTQPSFPLRVNRQQGCPPRFVFVFFVFSFAWFFFLAS